MTLPDRVNAAVEFRRTGKYPKEWTVQKDGNYAGEAPISREEVEAALKVYFQCVTDLPGAYSTAMERALTAFISSRKP